MKKHYVYKITDPITNQYYFGSRSNEDPKTDTYMGSMKTWKPKDKSRLIKEIIKDDFETREKAIEFEAELIEDNINDNLNENYYIPNKGFHTVGYKRVWSDESRYKLSESLKRRWKYHTHHLKNITWEILYGKEGANQKRKSDSIRMKNRNPMHDNKIANKVSEKLIEYYEDRDGIFLNKNHTEQSKYKMSKIRQEWWNCVDDSVLIERSKRLSENKKEWHNNNPDALIGDKNPASKKVLCICHDKEFQTVTDCAIFHNKSVSNISQHCRGKYKTQKFKFVK